MNQNNEYKPSKKSLFVLIVLVCLFIFTGIIYSQYQKPEQKSTANDKNEAAGNNNGQKEEQDQNPSNIAIPKSQTYYLEGVSEMNQKNYAEAINYFDQAISENPDEPLFYSDKSEAQYNLGDKENAIETLRQGITENPESDLLKSKLDVLTKDDFQNSNLDAARE